MAKKNEVRSSYGEGPAHNPQPSQQPDAEPLTPAFIEYCEREGISAEEGRIRDAWNAWRAALSQPAQPDAVSLPQYKELMEAAVQMLAALNRSGTQVHRMRIVGIAGDRLQEALKALGHVS